jgi:hypothetical protein
MGGVAELADKTDELDEKRQALRWLSWFPLAREGGSLGCG